MVLIRVDLPTLGTPQIKTRMGRDIPPRWGASSRHRGMRRRAGAGSLASMAMARVSAWRCTTAAKPGFAPGRPRLAVEQLDAWFVAGEGLQQGVEAGARDAGIEHFNDDIDGLDALLNQLAREVHVAGIPLDE